MTNFIPHYVPLNDDPRRPAALVYLSGSFFPSLPFTYVSPMLEAIDAVNDGNASYLINMTGLNPLPRDACYEEDGSVLITASALVSALRVDHMIDEDA